MKVLALVILFLIIIAIEAPGLARDRRWPELAAFSGVLLIAMTMAFTAVLDIPLPNPTSGINAIFAPVGELLDKLLSS